MDLENIKWWVSNPYSTVSEPTERASRNNFKMLAWLTLINVIIMASVTDYILITVLNIRTLRLSMVATNSATVKIQRNKSKNEISVAIPDMNISLFIITEVLSFHLSGTAVYINLPHPLQAQ